MLARRAAAYLLDVAICFLAFALLQLGVFLPLRGAFGIDDAWFHSGWNTQLYTLLTISLPVWAYFTFTQSSRAGHTWKARYWYPLGEHPWRRCFEAASFPAQPHRAVALGAFAHRQQLSPAVMV